MTLSELIAILQELPPLAELEESIEIRYHTDTLNDAILIEV